MTHTPEPPPGLAPEDYNLLVHFKRLRIAPPPAMYVTIDDTLVVRTSAPQIAAELRISLRYLNPQGVIVPEFYDVIMPGASPFFIPGAEGFLLSAEIRAVSAVLGQAYTTLELQRGRGSGDLTFGALLIAGYPATLYPLSYPEGAPRTPLDGRGRILDIAVAAPLAGADFSQVVSGGVNWIPRAVTAQLATTALAGTRQASIVIDDGGGNIVLRSAAASTQAPSLTNIYSWFNGGTAQGNTPVVNGGLPSEIRLASGWNIRSLTASIQATDQWSAVVITVEEFVQS